MVTDTTLRQLDDSGVRNLSDGDFLRYLDLKGDALKVAGGGIRLCVISRLAEYTRKEIPSPILKVATPGEYSTSRLWRARDVVDSLFRSVSDPYFRLEYYFKRAAA